jgi:hypothetical protein
MNPTRSVAEALNEASTYGQGCLKVYRTVDLSQFLFDFTKRQLKGQGSASVIYEGTRKWNSERTICFDYIDMVCSPDQRSVLKSFEKDTPEWNEELHSQLHLVTGDLVQNLLTFIRSLENALFIAERTAEKRRLEIAREAFKDDDTLRGNLLQADRDIATIQDSILKGKTTNTSQQRPSVGALGDRLKLIRLHGFWSQVYEKQILTSTVFSSSKKRKV